MMKIDHSEAFDLFSKWLSERTPLRCEFTSDVFRSVSRVRVASVSAERVTFSSDDGYTNFLRFDLPALAFGYMDFRDSTEVEEESDGALIASGVFNRVAFIELRL